MARYQSLPDRIDTVCTHVSDQNMCLNYGNKTDYNITVANAKCVFYGTGNSNSGTWTVPPGVCSIVIELWGSGGGGMGSGNAGANTSGNGGGGAGYASATIPTMPGCQYAWCTGLVGCYGCCATRALDGASTYVTGFNAGNLCACGGFGACTSCYQQNGCITGYAQPAGAPATNSIVAVGASGTTVNGTTAALTITRGGAAPMGGGIGAVSAGCNLTFCGHGGHFPGGGGGGGSVSTAGSFGGCGGGGLVKIWY